MRLCAIPLLLGPTRLLNTTRYSPPFPFPSLISSPPLPPLSSPSPAPLTLILPFNFSFEYLPPPFSSRDSCQCTNLQISLLGTESSRKRMRPVRQLKRKFAADSDDPRGRARGNPGRDGKGFRETNFFLPGIFLLLFSLFSLFFSLCFLLFCI